MSEELAIKIDGVGKTFKLPHEKQSSLKGTLINFYRRKKGYETQRALNEISFEVKKGEFFGIVGRNGSGKSTLLKILAGIYEPTRGTIEIRGKLTPFIELGVGFNPELTGRENVFLNGALLGFSRKEVKKLYKPIVAFAELGRFMDQKLKNYSSGMQVRLAFSIAIQANTDILVLDEVLAVGDAAFQQKCFDYFERLKKDKKTIVIVTHDMSAVKRFCDRAVLIDQGDLKLIGSPDEVANQYLFENLNTEATEKVNDERLKPQVKSLNLKVRSPIKLKSTEDFVFDVEYTLNEDMPVYLGFSVMYQGMSMLEQNTKRITLPTSKGTKHTVRYTLPLSVFNTDSFRVNVTIFGAANAEVLGYIVDACTFFVVAADKTKGGPVASAGGWTLRE